jgi:hypothetical protein
VSDLALDIQALLRALVEQQTALLGAHAESMRMQRVLVERLLASGQSLTVTAAVAQATVAPGRYKPSEGNAAPVPTVEAVVRDEPVLVIEAVAPMVATVDGPLAEPPQPATAPASAPAPDDRPALRVVGGTAIRSERYYQAARPTPAQRISPEGLDILKRIQSAGEVAQLVLVFGPHAGETLGQVAKSDPDYLRRLALTAQRPDVRAAAARLVDVLPSAPHDRRGQQRSRRGPWRGAS